MNQKLFISLSKVVYTSLFKPFFFLLDPDWVHERVTAFGETLGKSKAAKDLISSVLDINSQTLEQKINGIRFEKPVGLATGFDYDAKLTQILPSLGFGFGTVGTITNSLYLGNPKPMLGRLPKSKSLMVNKGFKNQGAKVISEKLRKMNFDIPIGISIGRTNSKELATQKESIEDIVSAFNKLEQAKVKNFYYELNISCPNLYGNISFYPARNLNELLKEVNSLKIKKPIYIKMPIEKENKEVIEMLDIVVKYKSIKGVIFGNLQKDRNEPTLNQDEVKKFKVGNFSGKPTEKKSNELIELAYKHYKKQLTIIGCGGIFDAKDAYKKILLGASLVQLITGMIYNGPQLIAQINFELIELLRKDGFKNIKEAVGTLKSV